MRQAERALLDKNEGHEYLPIDGDADFRAASLRLLLGEGSVEVAEGRVAALQSLSGTGSLRVGAAFLARFLPAGTPVYVSDPTWGNHRNIFGDAGMEWRNYRYFDRGTIGLDWSGLREDLGAAPEGSVVVLHGCAHNPTGIDPTREQWEWILELCRTRRLLPFFDVAYQGFATGDLEADAWAPRRFAAAGQEFLCAQSYAKNLGLYGERVGCLSLVVPPGDGAKETATRAASQLKRVARAIYSNPPAHGARVARDVISDPAMFEEWKTELAGMAGRILAVRRALRTALEARAARGTDRVSGRDWSFVTDQIGMFSYTGMTPAQCDHLTKEWHVYLTRDGRLSLAGLNLASCERLADGICDALETCE